MNPLPGVRLTVINPDPAAAYSGMLPGLVAGHYTREEVEIDLVRLCRFAGARLVLSRATGLDRDGRRVIVEGRAPVAYDIASIDTGVTSEMPGLPGFLEHAVPAKPFGRFAEAWAAFAGSAAPGPVAVIGGGVAGVELALAARHRLRASVPVTVIEAGRALAATGPAAAKRLRAAMERAGVTLIEGVGAVAVEARAVVLGDGRRVSADFTIGAGGARAPGWLRDTGLHLTGGYVTVGRDLASVSDPAIFAAGDVAHLSASPRPKAGVFAVRQAPVLLATLRARLSGRGEAVPFRPQRDYLKLVSAGAQTAVADKWGLSAEGAWVWRLKDRIDRRFMERLSDLPAMPVPPRPARAAEGAAEVPGGDQPLCGGCGAKVGRSDLSRALALLPQPVRPDVETGAGDDAAVLRVGGTRQVITTDHLRAFTADPWTLARVAAVHSLGDVRAMGAAPQAALAQVVLPRMSGRMQTETLAEIMSAAASVFGAAGAEIVGGHTSLGAEMSVGFTVTGLLDGPAVTQAGAKPGDALILTKGIGTGVILAAEMARAAPGRIVAGAFAAMSRELGVDAAVLSPLAHAMTDVTGFGLAGHQLAICEASGVGATLSLSSVPFLPGAEALARVGHGSTLLPANRQVLSRMRIDGVGEDDPRLSLLFDPQTAGGLLAAVPEADAPSLLARLREAGEDAAIVGRVTAGEPLLTVTP
jgi:selenide,water dikinase